MARYEFICIECPKAPMSEAGDVHQNAAHEQDHPMKDAPAIGSVSTCPLCERQSAIRVISSGINAIVKGNNLPSIKNGTTMHAKLNGIDTPITFVDHPHTDPAAQRQMADLARRAGVGDGVPNALRHAYRNEQGRMVVDVAAPIPDPLGALRQNKQRGNYSETTKKVNQPFKVRPQKKRKKK